MDPAAQAPGERVFSNAEIADRLASLAQLLAAQKENSFKIKAYKRAAAKVRSLADSVHELVRDDADLTVFAGIGEAISAAIREIVLTGSLKKLETLREQVKPEVADLTAFPRLDPTRVIRAYKKLGISTVDELRAKLESGELEQAMGVRLAQHILLGLTEAHGVLLYHVEELSESIEEFLRERCGVRRVEVAGDFRRRVEVIEELVFLIETDDFARVVSRVERYGGRTPLLSQSADSATFALPAGILLKIECANQERWGTALVESTGSAEHWNKLDSTGRKIAAATEVEFYEAMKLAWIPPELREGRDELEKAAQRALPVLVTVSDIVGELHAHSTSSDGTYSIEDMALGARERGYQYVGITDHSVSLKIAGGVTVEDLWEQIRFIDKLNDRLDGFRVLKSTEVDILGDGALDYPDDLLRELDYTVCSIHSRFGLGKQQQTERILRAMDNRYFNILGHATGRLLLKRPGYEIDFERVVEHARKNGCFFEINSSPDRLDLSAENARIAVEGGVRVAIATDAHHIRDYATVRCGIDQARRAGLSKDVVLNCLPWSELAPLFRR